MLSLFFNHNLDFWWISCHIVISSDRTKLIEAHKDAGLGLGYLNDSTAIFLFNVTDKTMRSTLLQFINLRYICDTTIYVVFESLNDIYVY